VPLARTLRASLVVLKEFPASYRDMFGCFARAGFARGPSMPMTRLDIRYDSFEQFLDKALSGKARRNVRRNLKASAGADLHMEIVDVTDGLVDELFPLYLNVFNRSAFHFEKLTKDYFLGLGARMKDKIRLFTWRLGGRLVAFNICMVAGDEFFSEYIGFDYAAALDLHLYFVVVRDTIEWAIRQGYRWFRSSGLNYDPKLHLRHQLDPIDLYVRHVSALPNLVLKRAMPLMTPARYDPILKQFANYREIW
jgi:predicted N-acyltransferase